MLLWVFIWGLCIGSFLNVLIDRIPRSESVLKGRSHCESCKKTLAWYDLIPLLSFISLLGKCRYCKAKLSYSYLAIELITGGLFVYTYIFLSNSDQFTIYYLLFTLYIVSSFIVVFFIDLRHKIIPNVIVYPAIIVSLLFLISHSDFLIYLYSAFGALIFFLSLFLGTKGRGMGFGDVQFSFLLGLFLGFPNIVVGLYLAFLTGAGVSLMLIIAKRYSLKHTVPFGPFLIIGSLIAFYWGDVVLRLFPFI